MKVPAAGTASGIVCNSAPYVCLDSVDQRSPADLCFALSHFLACLAGGSKSSCWICWKPDHCTSVVGGTQEEWEGYSRRKEVWVDVDKGYVGCGGTDGEKERVRLGESVAGERNDVKQQEG